MIVDNELNRLMVNPLPPGVRLHVVIGIPPPHPLCIGFALLLPNAYY